MLAIITARRIVFVMYTSAHAFRMEMFHLVIATVNEHLLPATIQGTRFVNRHKFINSRLYGINRPGSQAALSMNN